jgi:diamine N-acetyltransferase
MSNSDPGPDAVVTLREVTAETFTDVIDLSVSEAQKRFVAPNVYSLAQAYVNPEAWVRAIYAGEMPVGFLMLADEPEEPEYFLWRFMIDERYQGRGYGRQAIELLVDHVRARPGATELLVSFEQGEGGPEPFYRRLSFEPTGEIVDGEMVAKLVL